VSQYDCSPSKPFGSGGSGDDSDASEPGSGTPDEQAARKERVLHARIPESLDEAIRSAASELGMSVSNLVRNVLANALEVVEVATMNVPARAAAVAASMRKEAARAASDVRAAAAKMGAAASTASAAPTASPPAAAAVVLGWQEATLNLNAVCDRCNGILPRGTRAAISIPEPASAPRVVRCLPCLEELTGDAGDTH
jgi:hypothetical protein